MTPAAPGAAGDARPGDEDLSPPGSGVPTGHAPGRPSAGGDAPGSDATQDSARQDTAGQDSAGQDSAGQDTAAPARKRPTRKQVLLRLDPAIHDALARWAADDLRSVNAQIDKLLREALLGAGRLPRDVRPPRRPGRPSSEE